MSMESIDSLALRKSRSSKIFSSDSFIAILCFGFYGLIAAFEFDFARVGCFRLALGTGRVPLAEFGFCLSLGMARVGFPVSI